MRILFIVTSLAIVHYSITADDWNYEDKGPSQWYKDYPVCAGNSQSPIDVNTDSAKYDNDLPIVDRNYFYDPPNEMKVTNNGHSITISFTDGYTITDTKLLPFPVVIDQYHFHWGNATETSFTGGSEHRLDGRQFFGEFHIVHHNTKYQNFDAAKNNSDGLAVFAWFINVTYPQTNLDIENLVKLAEASASYNGDSGSINDLFSIETLLPPDLSEYYRYKGSLTTPSCDVSVVWTVFKQPIEITQAQAYELASSFYETSNNETLLINNFRPPQELNGRSVTKPRPLIQSSGVADLNPQIVIGVLSLIIPMFYLLP